MKLCTSCHTTFGQPRWKCPHCGHEPLDQAGILSFAPELASTNQAYPADAHELLDQLEENHFWFKNRSRLIVELIQKHFPSSSSFLEVGCGNGYVLSCIQKELPQVRLSGCDMYLQGLSHAARRAPQTQLFQMDIRHIPFRLEFDVAGAFDVLEHVPEDGSVLNELFQVVKPGGGIVLTVPQHPFLWTQFDEYSGHVRRYSSKELRTKVEKAGFVVERCSSFVTLLLPLLLLSRFLKRKGSEPYDHLAEFRINPWLNWLLERVLDFERILLRLNLNLPLGGSLFLVARKN